MNHISSEAMQKFYDMTRKDPVIDIGGRPYCLDGYGPITEPLVDSLGTHTLQGIVDAVERGFESELELNIYIHVLGPDKVCLKTETFGPFLERHTLIRASAYVTDYRFGEGYNIEQFIIALNSQFIQSGDRDAILKLSSRITKETSGTLSDDGVSQKMEVKQGVSMREKVEVKNPFGLRPYRTFSEIEQPESDFIFRVKDKGGDMYCSLHEADGAKWRIEAIENIKAFFSIKLPDIMVIA